MSIYTQGFDEIEKLLDCTGSYENINMTDDHIQYSKDEISIVIGLNSLRMLLVDNNLFASITMVPVEVSAGSLVIPCETKLALYNTDFRKDVSGLYISSSETFQISTLYNFDFGILNSVVPKYLKVLERMSTSPKTAKKVHAPTLEAAIESVRTYAEMYAAEE